MTLGETIRLARKAKKLTQRELAQKSGFSLDSVSRWERNERSPTANDLKKIAESLDTSIAFLMGETGEREISAQKMPVSQSESMRMFERLMKKMAAYSPDLVVHFRDLDTMMDQLEPDDIQALADAYDKVTGLVTRKHKGRMRPKSGQGDS